MVRVASLASTNLGAPGAVGLVTAHARVVTGDARPARDDVRRRLRQRDERGWKRRARAGVASFTRRACSLFAGVRCVARRADLTGDRRSRVEGGRGYAAARGRLARGESAGGGAGFADECEEGCVERQVHRRVDGAGGSGMCLEAAVCGRRVPMARRAIREDRRFFPMHAVAGAARKNDGGVMLESGCARGALRLRVALVAARTRRPRSERVAGKACRRSLRSAPVPRRRLSLVAFRAGGLRRSRVRTRVALGTRDLLLPHVEHVHRRLARAPPSDRYLLDRRSRGRPLRDREDAGDGRDDHREDEERERAAALHGR